MSCGCDGKQTLRKGQQENKDQQKKNINVCIGTCCVSVYTYSKCFNWFWDGGCDICLLDYKMCLQFMSDNTRIMFI